MYIVKVRCVIIFIFLGTFCCACNNIAQSEGAFVKQTFVQLQDGTTQEMLTYKHEYKVYYAEALKFAHSQNDSSRIFFLHDSISKSILYIDALKLTMKHLSESNPTDIASVKRIFVTEKSADTLYSMLDKVTIFALQNARGVEAKNSIRILRESLFATPSVEKWKADFFTDDAPDGTIMILYAFEVSVYQVAIELFKSLSQ